MSIFQVDPDISRARTLDAEFYTNLGYFEQAREKLFVPSWQWIGDQSRVAAAGSCHPFTLLPGFLDEPLVLVRDGQDTLRCLSNVCTHRGNLLVKAPCQATQLRCRYHGRLFELDGRFKSMPEFREVQDFPSASDDLPSAALSRWGNLLFASLSAGRDAREYLGAMMDRLGWLPLEQFHHRPDKSAV